jgi:hypothetical protein
MIVVQLLRRESKVGIFRVNLLSPRGELHPRLRGQCWKQLLVLIPELLVFVFSSVALYRANAQVSGEMLSGTVTSQSGAAIPNARVSLRDLATGAPRVVFTSIAGFYAVLDLPPGVYE